MYEYFYNLQHDQTTFLLTIIFSVCFIMISYGVIGVYRDVKKAEKLEQQVEKKGKTTI